MAQLPQPLGGPNPRAGLPTNDMGGAQQSLASILGILGGTYQAQTGQSIEDAMKPPAPLNVPRNMQELGARPHGEGWGELLKAFGGEGPSVGGSPSDELDLPFNAGPRFPLPDSSGLAPITRAPTAEEVLTRRSTPRRRAIMSAMDDLRAGAGDRAESARLQGEVSGQNTGPDETMYAAQPPGTLLNPPPAQYPQGPFQGPSGEPLPVDRQKPYTAAHPLGRGIHTRGMESDLAAHIPATPPISNLYPISGRPPYVDTGVAPPHFLGEPIPDNVIRESFSEYTPPPPGVEGSLIDGVQVPPADPIAVDYEAIGLRMPNPPGLGFKGYGPRPELRTEEQLAQDLVPLPPQSPQDDARLPQIPPGLETLAVDEEPTVGETIVTPGPWTGPPGTFPPPPGVEGSLIDGVRVPPPNPYQTLDTFNDLSPIPEPLPVHKPGLVGGVGLGTGGIEVDPDQLDILERLNAGKITGAEALRENMRNKDPGLLKDMPLTEAEKHSAEIKARAASTAESVRAHDDLKTSEAVERGEIDRLDLGDAGLAESLLKPGLADKLARGGTMTRRASPGVGFSEKSLGEIRGLIERWQVPVAEGGLGKKNKPTEDDVRRLFLGVLWNHMRDVTRQERSNIVTRNPRKSSAALGAGAGFFFGGPLGAAAGGTLGAASGALNEEAIDRLGYGTIDRQYEEILKDYIGKMNFRVGGASIALKSRSENPAGKGVNPEARALKTLLAKLARGDDGFLKQSWNPAYKEDVAPGLDEHIFEQLDETKSYSYSNQGLLEEGSKFLGGLVDKYAKPAADWAATEYQRNFDKSGRRLKKEQGATWFAPNPDIANTDRKTILRVLGPEGKEARKFALSRGKNLPNDIRQLIDFFIDPRRGDAVRAEPFKGIFKPFHTTLRQVDKDTGDLVPMEDMKWVLPAVRDELLKMVNEGHFGDPDTQREELEEAFNAFTDPSATKAQRDPDSIENTISGRDLSIREESLPPGVMEIGGRLYTQEEKPYDPQAAISGGVEQGAEGVVGGVVHDDLTEVQLGSGVGAGRKVLKPGDEGYIPGVQGAEGKGAPEMAPPTKMEKILASKGAVPANAEQQARLEAGGKSVGVSGNNPITGSLTTDQERAKIAEAEAEGADLYNKHHGIGKYKSGAKDSALAPPLSIGDHSMNIVSSALTREHERTMELLNNQESILMFGKIFSEAMIQMGDGLAKMAGGLREQQGPTTVPTSVLQALAATGQKKKDAIERLSVFSMTGHLFPEGTSTESIRAQLPMLKHTQDLRQKTEQFLITNQRADLQAWLNYNEKMLGHKLKLSERAELARRWEVEQNLTERKHQHQRTVDAWTHAENVRAASSEAFGNVSLDRIELETVEALNRTIMVGKEVIRQKHLHGTGWFKNWFETVKNYTTGADPDWHAFKQLVTVQLNTYVNELTGKQLSQHEVSRLKGAVPQISDDDPVFLAKAKTFVAIQNQILKRKLKIYALNGHNIASLAGNIDMAWKVGGAKRTGTISEFREWLTGKDGIAARKAGKIQILDDFDRVIVRGQNYLGRIMGDYINPGTKEYNSAYGGEVSAQQAMSPYATKESFNRRLPNESQREYETRMNEVRRIMERSAMKVGVRSAAPRWLQ